MKPRHVEVIVVEAGAEGLLAALPDQGYDERVILAQTRGEPASTFTRRVERRLSRLTSEGLSVASAGLAMSNDAVPTHTAARMKLAKLLFQALRNAGHGCLTLGASATAPEILWQTMSLLVPQLGGTQVSMRGVFVEAAAARQAA